MRMAHAAADQNHSCMIRHVGAVLVRVADHSIISTGYNGAPQGVKSCGSMGVCRRDGHVGDGRYDWCAAVHAEENCITFAAKHGVRVQHSRIYVTHKPCIHCLRLLIQAGVAEVVYDEDLHYFDGNDTYQELADRISMRKYSLTKEKKPAILSKTKRKK